MSLHGGASVEDLTVRMCARHAGHTAACNAASARAAGPVDHVARKLARFQETGLQENQEELRSHFKHSRFIGIAPVVLPKKRTPS